MKKIHILVLKAFLGPFVLTFAVVVFIFVTQTLVKYFDEIVGKGLSFLVYIKLLFYFSINTSTVAFPLSILLSSLIAFGNLGEYNELTAIKSSGISLLRALQPVFIFAVGLTLFAFWFNNNIVPKANLRAYSLLYDIRQKKPSLSIKEGIFYSGLEGVSIKANKKFPDGKSMKGLMIYDHSQGHGNSRLILADSAQMYNMMNGKYLVFELFNGTIYDDQGASNRRDQKAQFIRNIFKRTKMVFSLASFEMDTTPTSLFRYDRLMKNFTELRESADSLNKKLEKEIHNTETGVSQYYYHHLKQLNSHVAQKIKLTNGSKNWVDSTEHAHLQDPPYKKVSIIETAINQARNVKSNLDGGKYQQESALKEYRIFAIERHRRFTQSVACLAMFLIGAPLGSIIRKGGLGVPVLVSIGFFILFYVLTLMGEKWAREGVMEILYGTWLADFVLFMIGLFFLRQARNDSRLFDADVYKIAFNKFISRFKKTDKSSRSQLKPKEQNEEVPQL